MVALLLAGTAAVVPAPAVPSPDILLALLHPLTTDVPPSIPGPPLPDGSLPGDPGEARMAGEIATHHSAAVDDGIPEGSVIWFIADRNGEVIRTGIGQGSGSEVIRRVRARYPHETSDFALIRSGVPAGSGGVPVAWLLLPR